MAGTAVLLALWGTASGPLRAAQGGSASALSGTVIDATGAPVAAVEVIATDTDRNAAIPTRTNAQGRFQFLALRPGNYSISVRDDRFSAPPAALTIAAGQNLELPLHVRVASAATTVEVNATLTAMDAHRTQMSDSVSPAQVASLPLNGRNYLDLALLAPGVSRTNTGAPQQFAETSAVPGTGISFAGQRNLNNNFVLDGLSINDDAAGLAGSFFSQEVIREFQVIQANATPEFGRASSGTLSIVTQSGTNQWRGRLYDYFRNQRWDARNPLAKQKDPLTQSQYGMSVGGPIVKDRTFLFSNFEQTRRNAAGFTTISPANVTAINNALNAFGSAGPRITTGEYSTGWDLTNYFVRLDHQLTARTQLTGRYSLYDVSSPNARSAGGLNDVSRATRLDNRDHSVALSTSTAYSPSAYGETHFQFTRSHLWAPGNDLIGPAVSISGVANFGASTTSPVGRDNDLWQLGSSFTLVRGRHTIKAGADMLWNRLNIYFPGSAIAAVYSFSSLQNFQRGQYVTFQQAFGDPSQFQSNPNLGLYLQDEWRPLASLTVQYGVRYDIQKLPSPIHTDFNNIAPRFGIAWSPGDRKTVIRAGYGLFYDRVPLRATSNALQRDGSKYRVALLSYGQAGAPVFPQQLSAFPSGQYINISTIDFNIQNSYSHQATFQLERQFTSRLNVTAGYQWLRSLHLLLSRNINVPTLTAAQANQLGVPNLGRPNSNYGNISYYEGSGDSYFNGLLVSARYRASSLIDFRLAYTLSKSIDDAGNFFFSSPQNNANLRDDRGLSDNDQRHRVTTSAVLRSPFTSSTGTAKRWLGGWQLASMLVYTSALPFNVQLGTDRNFDTNVNDRPIGVGRNTGRGFNYVSLDARLSRTFTLTERWSIEALAEGFNTLNRSNWTLPNNTYGTGATPLPSFGLATAVFDPRQIQFGLRLNF